MSADYLFAGERQFKYLQAYKTDEMRRLLHLCGV
ncbi:MAG: hypothetical protein ACJAYB_001316 [Psychromonas sp.]|jgi:hypothetical protein